MVNSLLAIAALAHLASIGYRPAERSACAKRGGTGQTYPTPRFLHFSGVLGEDARRRLVERVREQEAALQPSDVTGDDKRWRSSQVLYSAQELAPELLNWLEGSGPALALELGVPQFACGEVESQLTVSGDGDYFRRHDDNGAPETATRRVSWVYYAHACPRRFAGGELLVYESPDRCLAVEPEGDSLIVFPSELQHEVRPVRTTTNSLDDARVTLNGWLREAARGCAT